jgi:ectoine hydroxylase-related dioxygenase (phytanoyl-CoA dioxygenase family)
MAMQSAQKPLSEHQIAEFYREGYLVVENLVDNVTIDQIVEEAKKKTVISGGKWTPEIFDFENPNDKPVLHQLLAEPNLISAVESILEAPARVYFGMLAVVPAKGGKGLEWHQDNMYDLVLGRALNVFVALCDITPDKAILWIAPRSHRNGVLESELVDGHRVANTPENGAPLPTLKKGSVAIFDRNTLHRSKTNETDSDRYAYAAQFQEDNARVGSTGQKDPTKLLISELQEKWR